MITSLTIENKTCGKWYSKIVGFILGDRINSEVVTVDGVVFKKIHYTNRRNKIDWELISDTASLQKNALLCAENVPLNGQYGLRRYADNSLNKRLCVNMAVSVAGSVKKDCNAEITIFDIKGDYTSLVKRMVKYGVQIKVVTVCTDKYDALLEESMEQSGTSFVVTESLASLMKNDFIVAPERIVKPLPVKESTVILTSCAPTKEQKGRVYFGYELKLPEEFAKIKPPELSDNYFACALYQKGRKSFLGNISPFACTDGYCVHTALSLANLLEDNSTV